MSFWLEVIGGILSRLLRLRTRCRRGGKSRDVYGSGEN
jgi:hypothetical protein